MRSSDSQRESWKCLLAQQEASGLSVSSWCRDHEVDKVKFYYWRKRLVGSVECGGGTTTDVGNAVDLDSPQWLSVGGGRRGPSVRDGMSSAGLTIRVGRIAVEVAPGFDRMLLTDVLELLEARE